MNGDIEDWRRRNMMSTPRASEYYETRMERGVDMRNNIQMVEPYHREAYFGNLHLDQRLPNTYPSNLFGTYTFGIDPIHESEIKQDTELAIVKTDKEVNIKLLNI